MSIEKNAEAMYQYCVDNGYGKGSNKKASIGHFTLVESELNADEKVYAAFIGLHNMVSASKHEGHFAYVVTDKRLIFAHKRVLGSIIKSVNLKNINDVSMEVGLVFSKISVDIRGESFSVTVGNHIGQNIYDTLWNALDRHDTFASVESSVDTGGGSQQTLAEQLEDLRYLLEEEIITQEEFDQKKKQILGL